MMPVPVPVSCLVSCQRVNLAGGKSGGGIMYVWWCACDLRFVHEFKILFGAVLQMGGWKNTRSLVLGKKNAFSFINLVK